VRINKCNNIIVLIVVISPEFCDFPTQQKPENVSYIAEAVYNIGTYLYCAACVTCIIIIIQCTAQYSRMSIIIITVLNVLLLDENSNCYDIFLACIIIIRLLQTSHKINMVSVFFIFNELHYYLSHEPLVYATLIIRVLNFFFLDD